MGPLRHNSAYGTLHGMHTQVPRNRLKELRLEKGLKLIDIAYHVRVDTSTVNRWQDRVIPHEHLAAVAALLDVSVPYLAGWSDQRKEPNGAAA